MHVKKILRAARERLVTMPKGAALVEAAKRLGGPATSLVLVCGADGAMCGVISKTDVVDRISQRSGASCTTPVAVVITRDVVRRRPGDTLREVWSLMKAQAEARPRSGRARASARHSQRATADAGARQRNPSRRRSYCATT